jgi:hypothetical protein
MARATRVYGAPLLGCLMCALQLQQCVSVCLRALLKACALGASRGKRTITRG